MELKKRDILNRFFLIHSVKNREDFLQNWNQKQVSKPYLLLTSLLNFLIAVKIFCDFRFLRSKFSKRRPRIYLASFSGEWNKIPLPILQKKYCHRHCHIEKWLSIDVIKENINRKMCKIARTCLQNARDFRIWK